jgi:hypothetical protein
MAMSLVAWFRRMLGPASISGVPSREPEEREVNEVPLSDAGLAAWMAACDAGLLDPRRDVHDRGAWDDYWRNHLRVGTIEQGFADQMSSDDTLPGMLARRGSRTILCAGNGMSTEATSLALHGFDVTALDISAVPAEAFVASLRDAEHPLHRIPGFRTRHDGSVSFDGDGPIDPRLCPRIHQSNEYGPRGGGSLSLITGDLIDPATSPGPFDVVIERRTVQLFPAAERPEALERLVARLAIPGVFVSHEHQGAWRPGDTRTHYAEGWLASRGFMVQSDTRFLDSGAAPRLALLVFSSG